MNERLNLYMGPLHDENSHGADAFGELAINLQTAALTELPPPEAPPSNAISLALAARRAGGSRRL